ncbi:very long chain fatty acid elongase 7 isoform 1-T2 [Aphomia sociella]
MASIYNWYRDLLDNRADPRVKDWPMMSSPWPTLAICICYAYGCKKLGPKIMANRKPFEFRGVLVVYNLIQTLFSIWIFYEYLASGWWNHYNFTCQLVDYSDSPIALRMAAACWWYYFSKFTEFADTIFFVMRKKWNQVSMLHIIHHGIMPFSVWMGLKFAPGGHSTFFALLNTFVHIIMYFYYMVSAMGPKYQKYVWWKKYLTALQLVQFVLIFTHQLQVFLRPSCQYPRIFVIYIAMHGFLFLFLFGDFYKAQYIKPQKNAASGSLTADESSAQNGYKQEVGSEVPSSYASSTDAFVRRRPVS